jgi:phosphohistidine phosphatase
MLLYLLRHGEAHRKPDHGRDEDRTLTSRGRDQALHVASLLAQSSPPLPSPRTIHSSPAIRAAQTAQIIAEALNLPVRFHQSLGLDAGSSALDHLIHSPELLSAPGPVLLVGHNPHFEELASSLTTKVPNPVRHLRTGELVAIDLATPDKSPARLLGTFRSESED